MTIPGSTFNLLLQAAGGGGGNSSVFFVEIALMIAIFYFIILRPQQRQRRQQEETLRGLKRGDEVLTSGGVIGEVIHIRETAKESGGKGLDDRITIKSGESRLVVERRAISRVLGAGAAASSEAAS